MLTPILMAASGTITLCAVYVAWYYAQRAESARQYANKMCDYANKAWLENTDLKREADRMADVIGKHQSKAHKCDKCNQFASKRKAKTAELQAYVASKKAA